MACMATSQISPLHAATRHACFARADSLWSAIPKAGPSLINCGVGIFFSYDLFEGGRKRATLREREAQLSQAKENLAQVTDEVDLAVQTAYNKVERTQQMLKVSEELVALRTDRKSVLQQQLVQGT